MSKVNLSKVLVAIASEDISTIKFVAPDLLTELLYAREVVKHAQEFHYVDKDGVYKNKALSAAILDYEEVVNAEG